jgi:glycosyltransferase involved in cell wall biosynthesis
VGDTIRACSEYFAARGLDYELILVNDGSRDGSWEVLRQSALECPSVTAVDLLHNYGQHTAVLCGLRESRGQWVVTLDDDLQNPPGEIDHLIDAASRGHDLVFGVPVRKAHGLVRRWGSAVVDRLNRSVFRKPPDLTLTNFRLIERRVVDRIVAHRTHYPYINGLAVLYARRPANVAVEHHRRRVGRSTYGPWKIAELIARILFNYSSFPLRAVIALGFVVSSLALVLAAWFLVRGLFFEPSVKGWASVAVMLAFFNGLLLLLMGMLGEYILRVLQQVSSSEPYHVAEIVRRNG